MSSLCILQTFLVSKEEQCSNKMYKTELCRNYQDTGFCKYNTKCQFAHSINELRDVERHPRYKTELCKNFLIENYCKYGNRCCFLHKSKETNQNCFFFFNYSNIWNSSFYIENKHNKYYEESKFNRAPGEAVRPM